MNRSFRSISILTGGGGDDFLSALSEPFESALKRISGSGGTARLIMLNSKRTEFKFLDEMVKKYASVFSYVLGVTRGLIGHFIVCDSRMIRVEEPHGELTEASLASVIKARVNFNDHVTAKSQEQLFEAIWDKLTPKSQSLKEK